MKYTLKASNLSQALDSRSFTKAPESWKEFDIIKAANPRSSYIDGVEIELMMISGTNIGVWMRKSSTSASDWIKSSDYFLITLEVEPNKKKPAANKVNISDEVGDMDSIGYLNLKE
jgi:hypothetical protein